MVAELVRDDVGLREVTRGAEAVAELLEEAEVEIDLLVAGAVERPDGGVGLAAALRRRRLLVED